MSGFFEVNNNVKLQRVGNFIADQAMHPKNLAQKMMRIQKDHQ